jgi:hypothetical protein
MFALAEFSNNRKVARGTHKIKCKNRGSLGRGFCNKKRREENENRRKSNEKYVNCRSGQNLSITGVLYR